MISIETLATLSTEYGDLYDVPLTVDFDPATGVAVIVSARIRDLTLTADDLGKMCDMRPVHRTVQEYCDTDASAIIADARADFYAHAAE